MRAMASEAAARPWRAAARSRRGAVPPRVCGGPRRSSSTDASRRASHPRARLADGAAPRARRSDIVCSRRPPWMRHRARRLRAVAPTSAIARADARGRGAAPPVACWRRDLPPTSDGARVTRPARSAPRAMSTNGEHATSPPTSIERRAKSSSVAAARRGPTPRRSARAGRGAVARRRRDARHDAPTASTHLELDRVSSGRADAAAARAGGSRCPAVRRKPRPAERARRSPATATCHARRSGGVDPSAPPAPPSCAVPRGPLARGAVARPQHDGEPPRRGLTAARRRRADHRARAPPAALRPRPPRRRCRAAAEQRGRPRRVRGQLERNRVLPARRAHRALARRCAASVAAASRPTAAPGRRLAGARALRNSRRAASSRRGGRPSPRARGSSRAARLGARAPSPHRPSPTRPPSAAAALSSDRRRLRRAAAADADARNSTSERRARWALADRARRRARGAGSGPRAAADARLRTLEATRTPARARRALRACRGGWRGVVRLRRRAATRRRGARSRFVGGLRVGRSRRCPARRGARHAVDVGEYSALAERGGGAPRSPAPALAPSRVAVLQVGCGAARARSRAGPRAPLRAVLSARECRATGRRRAPLARARRRRLLVRRPPAAAHAKAARPRRLPVGHARRRAVLDAPRRSLVRRNTWTAASGTVALWGDGDGRGERGARCAGSRHARRLSDAVAALRAPPSPPQARAAGVAAAARCARSRVLTTSAGRPPRTALAARAREAPRRIGRQRSRPPSPTLGLPVERRACVFSRGRGAGASALTRVHNAASATARAAALAQGGTSRSTGRIDGIDNHGAPSRGCRSSPRATARTPTQQSGTSTDHGARRARVTSRLAVAATGNRRLHHPRRRCAPSAARSARAGVDTARHTGGPYRAASSGQPQPCAWTPSRAGQPRRPTAKRLGGGTEPAADGAPRHARAHERALASRAPPCGPRVPSSFRRVERARAARVEGGVDARALYEAAGRARGVGARRGCPRRVPRPRVRPTPRYFGRPLPLALRRVGVGGAHARHTHSTVEIGTAPPSATAPRPPRRSRSCATRRRKRLFGGCAIRHRADRRSSSRMALAAPSTTPEVDLSLRSPRTGRGWRRAPRLDGDAAEPTPTAASEEPRGQSTLRCRSDVVHVWILSGRWACTTRCTAGAHRHLHRRRARRDHSSNRSVRRDHAISRPSRARPSGRAGGSRRAPASRSGSSPSPSSRARSTLHCARRRHVAASCPSICTTWWLIARDDASSCPGRRRAPLRRDGARQAERRRGT